MTPWRDLCAQVSGIVRDVVGDTVVYTHASGSFADYPVKGVYSEPAQAVDLHGAVPVSSTHPTFNVLLSDLQAPPDEGDTLAIAPPAVLSVLYFEVVDVNPDGFGNAVLVLRKAR